MLLGVLLSGAVLTGCGRRAETGHDEIPHLRNRVTERIRTRIEAAGVVTELRVGNEPVYESAVLPAFYVRRIYRPAWSDGFGPLPLVDDFVSALERAELEGLKSEDYHLAAIKTTLAAVQVDAKSGVGLTPDWWAELDLLLTDAFLVYGAHLLAGRANTETVAPEWLAYRRSNDIAALLETAVASGDVAGTLETVIPHQNGYRRLRDGLARYRALAASGGWPQIPSGPKLQRGDSSPAVALLRERLRLEGDLGSDLHSDLFNDTLDLAVRRFQRRHGLTEDGAVSGATRDALNVPVERRVEQLELNLERWRWLPKDLGVRHIIVNIAAYQLEVVDETGVALAMRVVVGRPFARTPILSDTMRYLVLNPYWLVPSDLATEELLPKIRAAPSFLARSKLRVFPKSSGAEAPEIDAASINWSTIRASGFPFRFRQDPGPLNALGRIKFIFVNKYHVYLHDTPARPLFERSQRDFSHGCIRLERPLDLAVYLLRDDPRWGRESLVSALDTAVDQTVPLLRPMPIHLLYWTAWADADGTIEFRRDIHQRDPDLLKALRAPPTPAKPTKRPA